jgi:hypothetical protein
VNNFKFWMIFNICTISKSEIQKLVHIRKLFKFQICSKLNLFKIKFVQIQISYLQNLFQFKSVQTWKLFKFEIVQNLTEKEKFLAKLGRPIWERLQASVCNGRWGRRIGAPKKGRGPWLDHG